VERHLCGEYAQLLCSGTGSIWVSFFTFKYNTWIVMFTCMFGCICYRSSSFIVVGFRFPICVLISGS
jgi:hypothetical protein